MPGNCHGRLFLMSCSARCCIRLANRPRERVPVWDLLPGALQTSRSLTCRLLYFHTSALKTPVKRCLNQLVSKAFSLPGRIPCPSSTTYCPLEPLATPCHVIFRPLASLLSSPLIWDFALRRALNFSLWILDFKLWIEDSLSDLRWLVRGFWCTR
jgi:hypothetical protein